VFTQNVNIPLNQSFNVELERSITASKEIIHSSFKPILVRDSKNGDNASALRIERSDKSWVGKRLFYEHFITLDSADFKLTIDPIVNFEFGVDNEFDARAESNLYKNTRGFVARLQFGKRVALESAFRENQAVLPYYLYERTKLIGVAYGQGRTKDFKEVGFDFAMASAYLSVSPNERINIQLGTGKHFVGEGHRSFLLSDVAFNSPFLRVNINWLGGKLQYQNLYTLHQDLNRLQSTTNSEGLFERKQAATHFLEVSPNYKLNIALFESTIFPSLDTSGNIPVGVNYWIPVIFLNTLLEGDKSKGNNKVGLNVNYKMMETIQFYGQLALQSGNVNYQIGTKMFPHKNIMLQAEFNKISDPNSNNLFTHYNESLSHPVNYQSSELIGIAQFHENRWLTRAAANFILNDNIDVMVIDFRQSFIVNPSYNFTLQAGVQIRRVENFDGISQIHSSTAALNSNFIYFGLSTNLQNIYTNY
tara:strand:+ start:3095 stop:4522 length:1428 start_codon:yes stop_codon:yes gene_type:complete